MFLTPDLNFYVSCFVEDNSNVTVAQSCAGRNIKANPKKNTSPKHKTNPGASPKDTRK